MKVFCKGVLMVIVKFFYLGKCILVWDIKIINVVGEFCCVLRMIVVVVEC